MNRNRIHLESTFRALGVVALTTLLCAVVPSPARACGISGDDGSYKKTCKSCSIAGTVLSCDCENTQRFFVHTSIDLADCRSPNDGDPLSNNDGRLFCRHCSTPGACCLADTSCAIKTFNDCESVGTFEGDNSVCANVSCPQQSEFHWSNASGGDFAVAGNWSPQGVPAFNDQHTDTAIFDLTGNPLIQIQAANNAVARWIVRHMGLDLAGPARVRGTATGTFVVDDGGKLLLEDGNTFSINGGTVGDETGAESGVLVAGAQTLWEVQGPLVIGRRAPGRVIVVDDGALDAQRSITVGNTVDLGAGDALRVGGTLEVEDGGHVTTPDLTLNDGSLQVRGRGASVGSLLTVASDLDIGGESGTGSVVVEKGGEITAQRIVVGDRAGTGGETVTISGVDSTFGTDGELHVAGDAATQIEVKDGGTLSTLGKASVGQDLAVGKVIVHGKSGSTRSSWDAFDDVFIGGQLTPSELIVEASGHVTGATQLVLGLKSGDIGRASVSDHGSRLDVATLVVGRVGRGELAISGGALVKSTTGVVGFSQLDPGQGGGAGSGLVTIDGSALSRFISEWHVTGDCSVGVDEPGKIQIDGRIGSAELRVDGNLAVGTRGQIKGSGTLTVSGRTFNDGFIDPGFSPGVIVIDGDYEQGPNGAVKIEAAGVEQGQFDVLHVTGNATLGGKLDLQFIDGYLPRAGDSFDFLQVDGAAAGAFDDVDVAGVAHGLALEMTMAGGAMRVTATNDAQPASCVDPDDADGDGALGCNFLVNAGMEEEGGSVAVPRGWVPSRDTADRRTCNRSGQAFAHTGECAYRLVGQARARTHKLAQTMVGLAGEAGRHLTVAAWARGRKIPQDAGPKIEIDLLNGGVVVKRTHLSLATGSYAYTRFARSFTTPGAYDEARIHVRYSGASGKLLIDDVSLGVE